ncbi:MAG: DUF4178 domain-containing protein [Aggregatilineales bacterium]
MAQMSCTSCGAPLQIENQFVRSVTCNFCGSVYQITGDQGLDSVGKTTSLANYPSRLHIGMRGKIKDMGFTILGRVRYTYEQGFWDEWQITWDDNSPPSWLEEDEGYWTLYRREKVRAAIPDYDSVKVGSTMQVNKHNVFVTEKRRGKLMGSEGQFAMWLPMQTSFGYATGTANNQAVSINYWENEIELSVGEDLEPEDMVML